LSIRNFVFGFVDQSRSLNPLRVKKIAAAVSAATKKNVTTVKEEHDDTVGEVIFTFKQITSLNFTRNRSENTSLSKYVI